MSKNINFQEVAENKALNNQKIEVEDVICFLISIFADNSVKHQVSCENGIEINLDNQLFEITVNKINS